MLDVRASHGFGRENKALAEILVIRVPLLVVSGEEKGCRPWLTS